MRIGDLDLVHKTAFFSGSGGRAKFGKGYTTDFFLTDPVFEDVLDEWVRFLKDDLNFGNGDPLFPRLKASTDQSGTVVVRSMTKGSTLVRKAFALGSGAIGINTINPHSVRSALVTELGKFCSNIEEYRALSQSMGHNRLRTTESYAADLSDERQSENMGRIRKRA